MGPTNVAMPTQVSPWRLPLHPLPCLVSLCRFHAILHRGRPAPVRPSALADTTCPPFPTVSTPPSGALGPSSGPCLADYDLSPFVDLSVAPQTQAGPRFLRHGGGKKTRSTHSTQLKPRHSPTPQAEGAGPALPSLTALLAGCYRLPGTPLEGRTSHGR